jgi:hypothetical protein
MAVNIPTNAVMPMAIINAVKIARRRCDFKASRAIEKASDTIGKLNLIIYTNVIVLLV